MVTRASLIKFVLVEGRVETQNARQFEFRFYSLNEVGEKNYWFVSSSVINSRYYVKMAADYLNRSWIVNKKINKIKNIKKQFTPPPFNLLWIELYVKILRHTFSFAFMTQEPLFARIPSTLHAVSGRWSKERTFFFRKPVIMDVAKLVEVLRATLDPNHREEAEKQLTEVWIFSIMAIRHKMIHSLDDMPCLARVSPHCHFILFFFLFKKHLTSKLFYIE